MLIQDMTREMSEDLLKRTHVGRLGCAQGSQPYVVPISFAYHREFIYSFATIGKKIEWMRANPLVCVEADEIVSRHKWQTVVIFGRFQELPRHARIPSNTNGRARHIGEDHDLVGAWLRQDAASGRRTAAPANIFSDFDQRDFRPSRDSRRLAR